jgi:hypothetical protein
MAPFIRWLTWLLWALPVLFVLTALASRGSHGLLWVALLLVVLYLAVWIWWRPGRFEVSARALVLVFPVRRARIAISDIESASVVDSKAFRDQFGLALRVGAGGLWGGFGWLWTRNGWVEFYISALDRYVLIRRRSRIPLLISPEDPERMVAMLEQQLAAVRA